MQKDYLVYQVNQLKTENDNTFTKQARGAQIRARTKWINEGELNPSLLSQLEQKHQTNNIINYNIKLDK